MIMVVSPKFIRIRHHNLKVDGVKRGDCVECGFGVVRNVYINYRVLDVSHHPWNGTLLVFKKIEREKR